MGKGADKMTLNVIVSEFTNRTDMSGRKGHYAKYTRIMFFACQLMIDLMILALAFTIADLIRHHGHASGVDQSSLIMLLPIYAISAFYLGLYTYDTAASAARSISRASMALAIALSMALLSWFAAKSGAEFSRVVFFCGTALAFVSLAVSRIISSRLVRGVLGSRFMRRILVIDGQPIEVPDGFEVLDVERMGLVPDVQNPIMLHNFANLIGDADRVVVSCRPERREQWAVYLKGAGCWGELLLPELHGIAPVQVEPHPSLVGVRVSVGPMDLRSRALKRIFDLMICLPFIILLTPALIIVAIAVKSDSPGPILFRQRRMGKGNRLFDVYKFRSMHVERTDPDGTQSASRDDKRITRVGKLIRATSLDELPQLFNVLEGDMSLVGPRPHALGSMAGTQLFWQVDARYWLRHAMKPGITGLAQVRGFRGATHHEDDLLNRLRSDLEYLANWTIFRDVYILMRTIIVLIHKNAY